jgi:hydrogenase maturation protein HypF
MRGTRTMRRLRLTIRGAVQGVGFRPFIYRLASELSLKGWVNNSAQGVFIDIEGPEPELQQFLSRLETEPPPRSSIQSLESSWLDPLGYTTFEIRESDPAGPKTALVLPDIATCPDCLHEILGPENRRHFYPFTNCTNCGPRFSIIESLPYDRANTSMKQFSMCPQCQAEYDNPLDRRFHAQPNACPVCGPHLELWDKQGRVLASSVSNPPSHTSQSVLAAAADALRSGQILAVKGLGGFHLMAAAHNDNAVRLLRERKHREEKPFALMFPSLDAIRSVCEVSTLEERLLRSPESPILLLHRLNHAPRSTLHAPTPSRSHALSPLIAPHNPFLGVMLPYTPLHHLLLSLLDFPVIATSGNLSDEPICTDELEALDRLAGIADLFLVHNRPIVRHVDDSIVRFIAGREMLMRRARGYAPLPVPLPLSSHAPVLAVGAHLKNTVALGVHGQAFLSQHIGDLETDQSFEAFRRVISDFEHLYETKPSIIAADAHPDYLSAKFARELTETTTISKPLTSKTESPPHSSSSCRSSSSSSLSSGFTDFEASHESAAPKLTIVQHHIAHVLSCMAENELKPPVLGVSWDGTGYGLDGSIWGGEFFLVTQGTIERVAHLRQFRLPGGDQAVKEPRRTALGLLYEAFGETIFIRTDLLPGFSPAELSTLKTMLARKLNSPLTSSVGRLFDAVSALAGLRQQVRFEGQAAMELEFALDGTTTDEHYPFSLTAPPQSSSSPQTKAQSDQPEGPPTPEGSADQPEGFTDSSRRSQQSGDLRGQAHDPGTPKAVPERQPSLPKLATPPETSSQTPAQHVPLILDWSPMLNALLSDLKQNTSTALISAKFHNALAEAILFVAQHFAYNRVVLSGGCFQNRYLTERAIQRLTLAGFRPYWHQRVPPNDGGLSLGQLLAALRT